MVCYPFLEGKCKYGDKCYKNHDTTILKIMKKSSNPIEKNQSSDSKASSGGGGNNQSSFVAASLPTQDFHQ